MRACHVAFLITSTASLVLADAPPKPATVVPTRAIPCAPSNAHLGVSGTDPLVCWDAGCMKLSIDDGTATLERGKPVAPPRWLTPLGEIRQDAGKLSACVGPRCKPLGKKLVAAIEAAKKDATPDSPLTLEATTDLKAVVVGYTAWNVAADKVLTPRAPYAGKNQDAFAGVGVQVAGDLLVFHWSNSDYPPTMATVNDSSGGAKSKLVESGGGVIQLDAKRFAVVSESATVNVFAVGTGIAKGNLDLQTGDAEASAIRVGDKLVLMHHTMQGTYITKVEIEAYVHEGQRMFLPACKP